MYYTKALVFVLVIFALLLRFGGAVKAVEPYFVYSYSCLLENPNKSVWVRDITTDPEGNVYLTGFYGWGESEVDFDCSDDSDIKETLGSSSAIYVTRYNADGSYGWTHVVTKDAAFDGEGKDVVVENGKLYVGGYFYDSSAVDFDDSAGTQSLTTTGSTDGFVSVYSLDGTYVNSYQIGGTGSDQLLKIDVDSSENIVVSGTFDGTVDFDLGAGTTNKIVSYKSSFFAGYTASFASLTFVNVLSGTSALTIPSVVGLKFNPSGEVVVAGYFSGTDIDLDGTTGTDQYTAASSDAYFSKYLSTGDYLWTRQLGDSGYESVSDAAVDSDGNIYVVGYADSSSIDFDASAGSDVRTIPYGDGFLTKYDVDGGYVGTYLYRCDEDSSAERVVLDSNDNVYVGGYFYADNADVDGTAGGTNYDTLGDYDSFVTRYTQDLSFEWSKRYGGDGSDTIVGLAVAGNSDLYVVIDSDSAGSFSVEGVGDITKGSGQIPVLVGYVADSSIPSISLELFDTTSDSTPDIHGTAIDDYGTVTQVSYQVDATSGSWITCVADNGVYDETSEDFTCSIDTALSDARHTVYFRLQDSNGNSGISQSSLSFTVDTTSTSSSSGSSETPDMPASRPVIYASVSTYDSVTIRFFPGAGTYTHYSVEYGRSPSYHEYGVNPIGDSESREFTLSSLSPNTRYYFVLTPVNQTVSGPSSSVYSAFTLSRSEEQGFVQLEVVGTGEEAPSSADAGTLEIYVKDKNENPVAGVEVTLKLQDTESQTEDNFFSEENDSVVGATDEKGRVEFEQVKSGSYEVVVTTKDGRVYHEVVDIGKASGRKIEITIDNTVLPFPGQRRGGQILEILSNGGSVGDVLEGTLGIPREVGEITATTAKVGGVAVGSALIVSVVGGAGGFLMLVGKSLLEVYEQAKRPYWKFPFDMTLVLVTKMGSFAPWMRKKKKGAGKVFESLTSVGVAGAYVLFYSSSGNLKTDFTDKDGKYCIKPPPDEYKVRVEADGYRFPSKVNLRGIDAYERVYKDGQVVRVMEAGERDVQLAIPIDRLDITWKQKTSYYLMKSRWIMSYVVLLSSVYSLLVRPGDGFTWTVVSFVGLYMVISYLGRKFAVNGVRVVEN